AQKKVSAIVGPKDPLISTMSMIQPGTGLIVAMAQSRPEMGSNAKKGETYWNLAVDPAMGGIQGYQAGSTFKAFTAAAALDKGVPLTKKYDAKKTMEYGGRKIDTCDGRKSVYGKWKVSNSTGKNGVMDMYRAAAFSVNNYFVQLELDTGMCRVTKMAQALGVKLGTRDRDLVEYYQDKPSFTLGSVEVSPLSMAEAYATFAARGVHCNPIIIDKITTREGKQLAAPTADCKRVIPEDVADGVNKLLAYVMTDGTGRRVLTDDRRPQAGKTGTINSAEAVWFVGYTPEIAGAAMISIDNQKKPFVKSRAARRAGDFKRTGVNNYLVPSSGIRLEGSGSRDAGMKIWKPTMDSYVKDVPKTRFTEPPSDITIGKRVQMPFLFGLGVSEATKKLEAAGFTVEQRSVYSTEPAGTFLGWSPSGGEVTEYSTIYAERSNGKENPAIVALRKARQRERQRTADALAREQRQRAADEARKAREKARKAEAKRKAAEAKKAKEEADAKKAAEQRADAEKKAAKPTPKPTPTTSSKPGG
nr:hypothetical protein [Propionibacteriaceae bacterium]